MDDFSITRWGKPLHKSLYSIDLEKKVFTSEVDNLVLDFTDLDDWTFDTYRRCTFVTGNNCTFNTYHDCIFNTFNTCTFNTGERCIFHTAGDCTFTTKDSCTFSIWDIKTCTFKSYNDGISIILDRRDNEAYKLTKEFVQLRKIANG